MTSPDARRAAIGGATDVGAVRQENEDSYGLWGPEAGDWDFLIAVADGVGGHEHGKQASELALSAFFSALTGKPLPRSDTGIRSALSAAMVDANGAVYSAFSGSGTSRPGSTFTCVLARGGKCYVGHVGDSRAYMIHGGRIFQLSTDHTWVQLQVETGTMTAEEAAVSPYRNQVLKVLGAEPNVEPDVVVRPTAPGDLFIVCSDGVTEHVSVSQLLAESATAISADGLAQTLVALAVAQGGSDNATAVVAGVPVEGAAAGSAPKPETTEIPLLRQPPGSPDTPAATPAPPTVPLPSVADRTRSRRDWRPILAGVLVALLVTFGLMLVNVRRHRGEPPLRSAPQADSAGTAAPQTAPVPPRGSATPVASVGDPAASTEGPVVKLARRLRVPGAEQVIAPSGSKFIVLAQDEKNDIWLECYGVASGRRLFRTYKESMELWSKRVVFSPDAAVIYYRKSGLAAHGDVRSGLCAADAASGATIWWQRTNSYDSGGLAISPDGKYLASSDCSSPVGDQADAYMAAIYDARSGNSRRRLPRLRGGCRQLLFSPRGSYLAAMTMEGLRVLRVRDLEPAYTAPDLPEGAHLLRNVGTSLALTVGFDDQREVWLVNWRDGHVVSRVKAPHLDDVSPTQQWYTSVDGNGMTTIRALADGRILQTIPLSGVSAANLSDDGQWLGLCGGDEVLIFEVLQTYQ